MVRDFSLHNARIWTGDPSHPWAESIIIEAGRIVALDDVTPRSQAGRTSLDAKGKLVTPGLIDAHTHLLMGGLALDELDLSGVKSRGEFEAAIASRHAQLQPGRWLIAGGWSNENWPSKLSPDKSWLEAAEDRPVVCRRVDIHAYVVNDAVLELINTTDDIDGGTIWRDLMTEEPTGLLLEAAAWELVNPLMPRPSIEEQSNSLRAAMKHYNSFGVTSVGSMEHQRDVVSVFEPLREELSLRVMITLMDRGWPMEFSFGRDFSNDDCLGIIGYKAFVDGTLGSRTARMFQSYEDDPGNRGMLVELAKDGVLREWAQAVALEGLSPSIHAIGDEATRIALDAIEGIDPIRRPRIEHAQQLAPGDIPRFDGVIASMQPLHKADDAGYVTRRLGLERLSGFFAFRGLLDAGAILAFGSDWPVVSCDPRQGILTAITGRAADGEIFTPQHNITAEEALRAYTKDAAYALGMDNVGMLRQGMLGDLVMFESDVLPESWGEEVPEVCLTVLGGQVMYDKGRD